MDISDLFDRPIAFQRPFVELGVGITGALLLSQAVYWSKRSTKKSGWFYKTQIEWTSETGLTRSEQETARKKLKKIGVLLEEKKGVPCKTFYKVDTEALRLNLASLYAGILQTGPQESCNQDGDNPTTQAAGIPQAYTDTTTENTSEITTDINKYNKKEICNVPDDSELRFDFSTSRWVNTESYLHPWSEAYPLIDIKVQLAKAGLWLIKKKHTKQGTKKKIESFITGWFSREQTKQEKIQPKDFAAMRSDWEPTQESKNYLAGNGIPLSFVEFSAMEFMLYWSERGDARSNWDDLFANRCLDEWATPAKKKYYLENFSQSEVA